MRKPAPKQTFRGTSHGWAGDLDPGTLPGVGERNPDCTSSMIGFRLAFDRLPFWREPIGGAYRDPQSRASKSRRVEWKSKRGDAILSFRLVHYKEKP